MKQLHNAIVVRFALAVTGVSTPSLKREEGQTFVEYALILALIAILVGVDANVAQHAYASGNGISESVIRHQVIDNCSRTFYALARFGIQ